MTKILIKRLSNNIPLPKYETEGSSGMDLTANVNKFIEIQPGKSEIIPTGLALSIPKNYEIQIRPRSGLAAKNQISVLNTPGTIDEDYRGEIKVILINLGEKKFKIEKGLRIAQMVLCPVIKAELEEVDELDETKRGSGGFGSTGIK
ncbi:dUTP diphosphatase [Candidatus Pelagibacter bacterium]|jgi:dUTP pyrophosphatase|nr:dUTP diphosphatase [Candidatus Pelagibacter bacterium]MDC0524798.1 dUTP diphosphatase [Pelagibacteraceae bacterium]MDA8676605.1 dUTP diphosphatase [Candidatus Pelagibacter bacterium]MDA8764312.1 dUTP diphosphatase [Candidatus Pelagibacter bacterium]MDA8772625.1 dUTP diphosphatase [Candidatus Pelagibacter bacterium]